MTQANSEKNYTIQNKRIGIGLSFKKGVEITSIYDRINNFEFLCAPSSLFSVAVNRGRENNSNDMDESGSPVFAVTNIHYPKEGMEIFADCYDENSKLQFVLAITLMPDDIAAHVSLRITNMDIVEKFLMVQLPSISNLTVPGTDADPARLLGMIPQEIGGVVNLRDDIKIGMPNLINDGTSVDLPIGLNVMEVANLYDRDGGGGVFFADLEGDYGMDIVPIQFTLQKDHVEGRYVQQAFMPGQTTHLPKVAIGVNHSGDYRTAVDYFVDAHKENWMFPDVPAWMKEAGGLWSTGEEGSGGAYELLPGRPDLAEQIGSFAELPHLYKQAQEMGTNFFYLNNYWERNETDDPCYRHHIDGQCQSAPGESAAE